ALMNMLFVSPFSTRKLIFAATGMRKQDLRMRDLIIIRDMLESGKITTVIDRIFKLEQIQDAHSFVDQGHKRGNVVINFAQ
ncbi:MAG: NADPH:quinone reductase-like Zn-dependent oxidoreductase, partial [Bacteroidia bacterium]